MDNKSRRQFFSAIGAAAAGAAFIPHVTAKSLESLAGPLDFGLNLSPQEVAMDEKFWAGIRTGFDLPEGILNLDNGYCNPLSRAVADDLVNRARYIEQLPAKRLSELYEEVTNGSTRPGIAKLLGVTADEIALVRNATEALDTVILGIPMKAGDEIVCAAHDYYAMLDAIEQRRDREGIVMRMIRPPLPAKSVDELALMYENAIGPKTKLVLVTHASNTTGQIYPVKRIAAAAHRAGAEVVVDGAQTMALLNYKIPDLDCDYYGASLHKWLMAPVGCGVLWMRKEHVSKVWPLIPPSPEAKGMLRFEWSGTYPEFVSSAAASAVAFHEKLGIARKEARAKYLTNYWRNKVEKMHGVKFYTTSSPDSSCGLGIFEIANFDSERLQNELWKGHKILVQKMSGGTRAPELRGIRVTPNVYTSTTELDRFVEILAKIVKKGTA